MNVTIDDIIKIVTKPTPLTDVTQWSIERQCKAAEIVSNWVQGKTHPISETQLEELVALSQDAFDYYGWLLMASLLSKTNEQTKSSTNF